MEILPRVLFKHSCKQGQVGSKKHTVPHVQKVIRFCLTLNYMQMKFKLVFFFSEFHVKQKLAVRIISSEFFTREIIVSIKYLK